MPNNLAFWLMMRAGLCDLCQSHRIQAKIQFSKVFEQAGPAVKTPKRKGRIRERAFMSTTMTATQYVVATIKGFTDRNGNPAQVQGKPSWLTDNSDVLAIEPADDGMSCKIKAVGIPGAGKVQMSADGDLGDGVQLVQAVVEFTIVPAAAVNVEIDVGAPQEQ